MLALAQLLSRTRPIRAFLVFLGRRTAPVYVMHAPLLVALSLIPGWTDFVALPGAKVFMPVVVAAAVVAICLLVYSGARRTPLRALFSAPRPLRSAVVRVTRPPTTEGAMPEANASRSDVGRLHRPDGETS